MSSSSPQASPNAPHDPLIASSNTSVIGTSSPSTASVGTQTPPRASSPLKGYHSEDGKKEATSGDEKSAHQTASTAGTPAPVLDANGEHLLETSWTFWYDHKLPKSPTSPQNYADHLTKLGTFSTIEGFFRMYSNLLRPNDLPRDSNYHIFRGDITPMWENFPHGGSWILKVKRRESQNTLALLWEQLLFAAIGEAFEEPKVVGVVLSTRSKADVLAVWCSDGQNQQLRLRMGDKLRMILNLDRSTPVEYKLHSISLKDKSTYRNGKVVPTEQNDNDKGKDNKDDNNNDNNTQDNNNNKDKDKKKKKKSRKKYFSGSGAGENGPTTNTNSNTTNTTNNANNNTNGNGKEQEKSG